MRRCGLASGVSGYVPEVNSCVHGNDSLYYTKCGEFVQ